MKKTEPKFAVGTKISTTQAEIQNGTIIRKLVEGVVTGSHDYYRTSPRRASHHIYHVALPNGLEQPYSEAEVASAITKE